MFSIIKRMKNIILKPRKEWDLIALEVGYKKPIIYLAILFVFISVVQSLTHLIKGEYLMGMGTMPQTITLILISNVVGYISMIVIGVVLTSLQPFFTDSAKDFSSSMKLISYSYTPIAFSVILYPFDSISILANLFRIYTFIIFWFGLLPVINCYKNKRLFLLILTIIISLLLLILLRLGMILA